MDDAHAAGSTLYQPLKTRTVLAIALGFGVLGVLSGCAARVEGVSGTEPLEQARLEEKGLFGPNELRLQCVDGRIYATAEVLAAAGLSQYAVAGAATLIPEPVASKSVAAGAGLSGTITIGGAVVAYSIASIPCLIEGLAWIGEQLRRRFQEFREWLEPDGGVWLVYDSRSSSIKVAHHSGYGWCFTDLMGRFVASLLGFEPSFGYGHRCFWGEGSCRCGYPFAGSRVQ